MFADLPRVRLAHLPTPLEPLERLTKALGGPQIYIKRDDLTGLAGGGNKARKLEFLVADALASKADSLITVGAAQSNHCRQTAAAASRYGLRCMLVLRGGRAGNTGNLLLDYLLGAEVHWSGERSREEVMEEIADSERASGRHPYPIPLGGSNALGAAAYALAAQELFSQTGVKFDRMLFASSSGGTHAGLAVGARIAGYRGDVFGISIDEEMGSLQEMVAEIATATSRLAGTPHDWLPKEIHASADYLGEGYGIMGAPEREAIEMFARLEGILLDPVYTGRAAAGMIDMIRRRIIGRGETILFWHTGGTPALWAYADQLA